MNTTDSNSTADFVVGIGASAGGLRALKEFFEQMPSDSGAAFVVVQHLSPDHESLMNELLQRHTHMAVERVTEQMPLAPNTVFLIPPGQNLILENNCFHLIPQERSQGRQLNFPIDLFFRSLAAVAKERAISIILSGTGSDGSQGIQEISERGGISLVQTPETAEFDGMPQNAIATNIVDLTLAPRELALVTYQFVTSPTALEAFRNDSQIPLAPTQLQQIINLIEQHEQVDFTHYKLSTLTRRIQRRCLLTGNGNLENYIRRLESSETERQALRNDLLITVTRFFRDLDAWEILEHTILPQLIERVTPHQTLRIWVTACATGEEAYSMAILLKELLDKHPIPIKAKIFATDIDQVALDKASSGWYPASSISNLSQARRNRFFSSKDDGGFEVARSLREMIIFANHNLAKDVGFTSMDLVSCRNVLIYMQYQLQHRVLRNLHFALNAKGILFLGESETLGPLEPEFKPLFRKWKIYQKLRDVKLPLVRKDITTLRINKRPLEATASSQSPRVDPKLEAAFKALLTRRETTCLLVNQKTQLFYVCSDTLNLLKVPDGQLSKDVVDMLPQPLQLPLSTALHRIREGSETYVQYHGCEIKTAEDSPLTVSIEVSQETTHQATGEFFMVLIAPEPSSPKITERSSQFEVEPDTVQYALQLEQMLQQTQENLQATVEELATTNEEQQATNEELIASNEELQSTNEELQSVNEELYTVNAEYQFKIQQLTELTNDLNNLLENIDIGVIFLDNELCIRKFTPAANIVFNLVDADVNRPIGHLANNLDNIDILSLLEQAQQQVAPLAQEVRIKGQGLHLLLRIYPYHTENQVVDGLILTFVNIDDIKKYQLQLETAETMLRQTNETLEQEVQKRTAELVESQHFLESINQATPNKIYIFDLLTQTLVFANQPFEALLGYSSEELLAMGADYHQQIVHPDDQAKFKQHEQAILQSDDVDNAVFEIEYRVCDASGNWHWLYSQETVFATASNHQPILMLGVSVDISDRKIAEAALQASEERCALVFEGVGAGIWDWNILTDENLVSYRFKQILGYEDDEIDNPLEVWETRLHPDDKERVLTAQNNHLYNRTPYKLEYRLRTKTGAYIWVYATGQAIWNEAGNPVRMAGSITDISDRKAVETER